MELILWRHAEAEDGFGIDDSERALTRKGRRQAERMAEWLRPRLAGEWRVLVSPARRTLETVDPLGLSFDVTAEVGTGADAQRVLRVAGWPAAEKVMVVGHQPTLGQVAAHLVAPVQEGASPERLPGDEMGISFRKGAVWWFAIRNRGGAGETVLRAVMNPDMLET